MGTTLVRNFSDIRMKDLPQVGGKNASLGEMYQALKPRGINIPEGFVLTSEAFATFIQTNKLSHIYDELDQLDHTDVGKLAQTGKKIREEILSSSIPKEISADIKNAYSSLCQLVGRDDLDVAVRSSATAEDLPEASFAGQQETFLNIQGEEELLKACLKCYASLFTDRAISYRQEHGFDHRKVLLSIGIQQMIRSDLASSGVIFTLDTESGARNVVLVTSSYGLGENIVGGRVDPDEFLVVKSLMDTSPLPIIRRKLGGKQLRMIYGGKTGERTFNKEVTALERERFSINDEEVLQLAKWAHQIEEYYSDLNHRDTPMDLEWAKDGNNNELYILQARPETVHAVEAPKEIEIMKLKKKSEILLKGKAVGTKIATGKAKLIHDVSELQDFKEGEILVAEMTDPDWEPVMKKARAIITEHGGRTCHAAIVSREHGIPCIVGTGTATTVLKTGDEITVSCAEGEEGLVMKGNLPFTTEKINWEKMAKTKTEVMVNIGNPDQALKHSLLPVDGVGLARLEFIIAEHVKIHPMALIHMDQVKDQTELNEIKRLIKGYEKSPTQYFINKLAEGIGMIGGAFYPRTVIVRLSDFKTNEYAHLLGGSDFEPKEENPMIGFRGASRYYSPQYREGFALECAALKLVREEIGLRNVKVMVPFCRTANEGKAVIKEMAKNGLIQGQDDLEIYVMCEIPSNVMDLDAFARIFDGFSIGSNDLTQMTLGVDRDSELISHLFNERDPASLRMLQMAVEGAKRAGRHVGICGQAPSDYPEIASFLVERGIDSISLTPDSVMPILKIISEAEERLRSKEMQMQAGD